MVNLKAIETFKERLFYLKRGVDKTHKVPMEYTYTNHDDNSFLKIKFSEYGTITFEGDSAFVLAMGQLTCIDFAKNMKAGLEKDMGDKNNKGK